MSTGLLKTPSLGPCKIQGLRPYQEDAITAIREQFAKGSKRTLAVIPTGGGKTIIFGMIARRCVENGKRVLILAHTNELIEQAVDKLDHLGVECGIEKAERRARSLYDPDVVVACVASLRPKRLAEWDPDYFWLIVVDECHHATAGSYKYILQYFKSAKVLGVTATADRADGEDLGQVFDSTACEYTIFDLMDDTPPGPFLSTYTAYQCGLDIDLRGLRVTKGDFTLADIEAKIAPLAIPIAKAFRRELGERPSIIFAPQIASAQGIATALHSLGVNADWVSGDDPDRAEKIRKYQNKELQMLVNAQVLLEGFDAPHTSGIGLARPTNSRALCAQMIGRGLRLYPGKDKCIVADLGYLTNKHKPVHPVELCDKSTLDSEVIDIAKDLMMKDKNLDVVEAVKRAEQKHKELEVVRVKANEERIKYRRRVVDFSPRSVCDAMGMPFRKSSDAVIHKATKGQAEYLKSFGVENADGMSKHRAQTMLDYLSVRRKQGLASVKQVSHLIAHGVAPDTARAMTKSEASTYMQEVLGWQKRA